MTEYDFVIVQMTKINARVLQFFQLNNARTRRVSALRCEKNQRTSALIFVICTSTKSYQSLTSFIHVIKEIIMECIYLEIGLNYQNDLIVSEIQFSMITRDQNDLIVSEIQFSMITRDQNGSC